MTEEVEAVAAPQVAVEQHTCGEEDGHTLYPAALASQQAVFEDGELFTRLLQDLNAKLQTAQPKKYRPSKYRVPTVAGKDLSLHALYRQVTGFGGVMAVAADNKWSEIIASFSFQAKVNLSAIKRIYSSLLWHFEQVYLHNASGQQLQEPPELPAGSVDPALQDGAAAGAASRPARNRRGTSLAALIAASDGIYSEEMDDADAPAAAAGADVGKSSDGAAAAATGKAAADGKTPPPAAAAGKEGGKPPQQQHRSRAPSQQRGGGSSGAGQQQLLQGRQTWWGS
ncbi:hypothetical protein COO60DRAFT_957936 [Scenedesmus sp. NREL 46B-D3]|nr:hypothetical protein COO60DRAFT_957936 [Scenedesmus sp. NREL 46B-D3]